MFLRKNKKAYYLKNCDLFGYQVDQEKIIIVKNGEIISSSSTIITKTDDIHPIDDKCFNLINIINNPRKPSKLEENDTKIKAKILTLFD